MSVTHLDSGNILSQATVHNGTVYLCGLTADDLSADITVQTQEVLAKIDDRLAKCGSDKSKILMATLYLSDMTNKPAMNDVWTAWLGDLERPARACVGTDLGPNVLVEIVVNAAQG